MRSRGRDRPTLADLSDRLARLEAGRDDANFDALAAELNAAVAAAKDWSRDNPWRPLWPGAPEPEPPLASRCAAFAADLQRIGERVK